MRCWIATTERGVLTNHHRKRDAMTHRNPIAAALLVPALALGLSACGSTGSSADKSTDAASDPWAGHPQASSAAPLPDTSAAYDADTATTREKWDQYQKVLVEAGVSATTYGTDRSEIAGVSRNLCDNSPTVMAGYADLMRGLYPDAARLALAQKNAEALTEAYCPEQSANVTAAFEAPPANPDGTYTSSCDYVLGDFSDHTPKGFRFVADATLHNTGNVGTVTEVKAVWFQAGGGKVTETKTVRIRPGQHKRVGITKLVGQDEIHLIQALDGDDCKVTASMVDTFGKPTS